MKSLLCLLSLAAPAFAATSYVLPGNAEYGVWNLNVANYNNSTGPGYPASGGTNSSALAWGGPIAATGSSSATFTRLTGSGYFISSGSGIYGTFPVGSYGVSDVSPITNLSNLLFQVRLNQEPVSVTLNINGIATALPATGFLVTDNPTVNNDYAWQWDLSSLAGTITSYEIVVSVASNNLIYGNAADLTTISASDSYLQAVPEPSAALLGCAALGFTMIRRRRA